MRLKSCLITILLFTMITGGTVLAKVSHPFMENEGYIILLTDIRNGIADQASQQLLKTFEDFAIFPKHIFVGGDLTVTGSKYEFYMKLEKNYMPFYSTFPITWLMGDLDTRWSEFSFYFFEKDFSYPYWSKNFDQFVFIGLNSATLLEYHGHFGNRQIEWLKSQLKEIGTEKPVIIQTHHAFVGPSQFTDDGYKILEVIKEYNVPLILIGNDSNYEVQSSYNHTWIQMLGTGMDKYYSPLSWDQENFYLWEAHLEKGVQLRQKIPFSKRRKAKLDWISEPIYKNQTVQIYIEAINIEKIKLQINNQTKTVPITQDGTHSIKWKLKEPLSGKELIQITGSSSTTTMLLHDEILVENPDLKWIFSSGDSIHTQPAVDESTLYFGNEAGQFFALDKRTGETLWSYQYKWPYAIISNPTLLNNMIIFGSTDTNLYALNKTNGKLIWKTRLPGVIYGGAVVGENLIAIGTGDHHVYGLNPANGEILWKTDTWGMIQSSGAYSAGKFIFTSWGGVIVTLDELTGELIQIYQAGSGYATPGSCTPTVYDDRLLYTNTNSKYYGQSLTDTLDAWVIDNFQVGHASVAVDESFGYLSTLKGQIFQFDPHTGEQKWLTNISQPIYDSSPQIFRDYLVVGTLQGDLWILKKDDGQIIKQISLGNGFIFGKIRATDDMVYVGSMDGNLYAIDVTNLP